MLRAPCACYRSISPARGALSSKPGNGRCCSAVNQWDRETDRRTDGKTDARPFHRPCSAYNEHDCMRVYVGLAECVCIAQIRRLHVRGNVSSGSRQRIPRATTADIWCQMTTDQRRLSTCRFPVLRGRTTSASVGNRRPPLATSGPTCICTFCRWPESKSPSANTTNDARPSDAVHRPTSDR